MKNAGVTLTIAVFACILLAPGISPATADVIFNNFGTGDDYEPLSSLTIEYDPDQGGQVYDNDTAMAFTPSGNNYFLDTIEMGLSTSSGDNEIDVWLTDDNSGEPGAVIEAIHLSGALPDYPGVHAPVVAASALNPVLQQGVQYWVVVSASGPSASQVSWHLNTTGYAGLGGQRELIDSVGGWTLWSDMEAVFRVTGIIVPEPATLGLLLLGGLALFGHRRST